MAPLTNAYLKRLSQRLNPIAAFPVLDTDGLECIFFLHKLGFHAHQPILVLDEIRFAEKHFVVAAFDIYYRRTGTGIQRALVAAEQTPDVCTAQEPKTVSAADRASGTRLFGHRVEQGPAEINRRRLIFFIQKNLTRQSTVYNPG